MLYAVDSVSFGVCSSVPYVVHRIPSPAHGRRRKGADLGSCGRVVIEAGETAIEGDNVRARALQPAGWNPHWSPIRIP